MWLTPNVERLQQLDLRGFDENEQIAFCPDCGFQYPPKTVGPSQCPTCGVQLHVTRNTAELRDLHSGYVR